MAGRRAAPDRAPPRDPRRHPRAARAPLRAHPRARADWLAGAAGEHVRRRPAPDPRPAADRSRVARRRVSRRAPGLAAGDAARLASSALSNTQDSGGRGVSVQEALSQFKETEGGEAFRLQNSKLLKVELAGEEIQTKLGSMVAYQGDVKFEHAGSGGLSRMIKKAVTSEGTELMKVSGQRRGLPRRHRAGDPAAASSRARRSPSTAPTCSPSRPGSTGTSSGSRAPPGRSPAASTTWSSRGPATVALVSDGPPVLLELDGDRDLRRPAGGDHLVRGGLELGEDRRQPEDVHRQGLRARPSSSPSRARAGC